MSYGPIELDGRYPLREIRVADFTWVHAGPASTRPLADMGAEVIKIESTVSPGLMGGPNPATPRGRGQRHIWNAGKLSLMLNMATPQAQEIARRLVAVSDVVTENFSRRIMSRWGLDYESLRKIKPDLIQVSMSGLGHTGPWKDYRSFGQTLQTWSCFTVLTGFPNTDPCGPGSAYSDAVGGLAGAQAVLLALIHRARTGEGQRIDLGQYEALSSLLETMVLDMSVNDRGEDLQRTGNRLPHGGGSPHGAYRCKGDDRWVAITVFTDAEWEAFVHASGDPPWARDRRFNTATGRHRHSDELDRLVESWTLQQTAEEVMHRLQAVRVAAGVVQSGADLVDLDPQLKDRGFFPSFTDSQDRSWTIEGTPYKLSRTSGGPVRGAPDPGSHLTYILHDVLGMSNEELAEYAIEGVFE